MTRSDSYRPFSQSEVDAGLAYALDEHERKLNPNVLLVFADLTRELMMPEKVPALAESQLRTLEEAHPETTPAALRALASEILTRAAGPGLTFEEARARILARYIPQKDRENQLRRAAYSAALGKMFSDRSHFLGKVKAVQAAPKPERPRKEPARGRKPGTATDQTGQRSWII